MRRKNLVAVVMALAAIGVLANVAFASGGAGGGGGTGGGGTGGGGGGGGGGGTTTTLPTPAIAPGTFDGIGPGPVYIHDSFGANQGTRYGQNGSIVDIDRKPEVNGIRAEFPNNKSESWLATDVATGPRWQLTQGGFIGISTDPSEPYTPLQDSPVFGYTDGALVLLAPDGAADTRPAALLPFAAPVASAYTVSADMTPFVAKTAIGFSSSGATNANFEASGQAWLDLDTTNGPASGFGPYHWTFHTNGLAGTTVSGTYGFNFATNWNRVAVSYDPVSHLAEATIDGIVVASVPYTTQSIRFVGVEGSGNADVNNFTVSAGTVHDPLPDSVAAPATRATTKF